MNILQTFNKLNYIQQILVTLILATLTYVFATGASYSIFSNLYSKGGLGGSNLVTSLPSPSNTVEEDPNEPRTEVCPLDGDKHTKKARESWQKRRPLAVMIENHSESRPQSGLSSSDIIYEAVAEGGITRFMALFYCNLSDTQVER